MQAHRLRHLLTTALTLFMAGVFFYAHAQTFKNPGLIQTTYDPQTVATADLNDDGIPDLVYTDGISPYGLHILLGNGDGSFSHKADLILPSGLGPIVNLADVTNDGVIDIIVGGATSSVGKMAVFPGKGNGTFAGAQVTTVSHGGPNGGTASFNSRMAFGDINGDGAIDLVVADATSATIYVLLGNNTGTFTLSSTLSPYYFTGRTQTYLFDVNGDGSLDTVVNDLVGGQTYVLLGKGNGTFKSATVYVSRALLFTDLNGDGHPDLVGTAAPGQIQVLQGNPDGTFGSPTVIGNVPAIDNLVGVGDFNGDGSVDLLLTSPVGMAVALGQGNFSFGDATGSVAGAGAPGYYIDYFAIGKYGGNAYSDVAMAVNGGLLILTSNGDGTFASADFYDIGTGVGTVSVGDYNGDKLPDIAVTVSANYPRVLGGNGTGGFSLVSDQNQSYLTTAPSESMVTADFNGDGKSDVDILEDTSTFPFGQPVVLYGDGNATFSSPVGIATGPLLVGDFNNDGRDDMISTSSAGILVMLGQTNNTFTQVTTAVNYPTTGIAAIGDLNGDGKLDALTFESGSMRVWLGKGDGTFAQASLVSTSSQQLNVESLVIADVDGDGNRDIVVVPYPNQNGFPFPILVHYGNGDGTFQAAVSLPISHPYTQLVVADVNQDHKPDLIMSDGSGIAVTEGQGNRTFGAEQHFVAGQQISGLTVKDVNGDGFPDIVVANYDGTTVVVLLNEPNGKSPEGAISSGSLTASPNPAQYTQPVTLSITLSVSSRSKPTGTVSFGVDGTFIGTATLANGVASYTYNGTLNTGSHTVVAAYNGDQSYASENFTSLLTVQSPVYPTNTVLVAAPTNIDTSQTVRLTVTVTGNSAAVPAGNVVFLDGTATLGVQQIYNNSLLELDTNLLSAGTHTITAVYQGWQDPFNEQAIYQPSTSTPVRVVVNATATTTQLTSSTTSATTGSLIMLSANVSSRSANPFGGVTFYDGSTALGTSSLEADGTCKFSTASLANGTHTITAKFNANATFAASTSGGFEITISAVSNGLMPTAVAVITGSDGGQPILQAFVAAPNGRVAGQVNFLDGGAILGTAVTDEFGIASLALPMLSPGAHNLLANFGGNGQFAPSVSPVLTEQIPDNGSAFALSLSSRSVDLTKDGQSLLVTVTASVGGHANIQFSCGDGLPEGYECVFSPPSLSSGTSELRFQHSSSGSKLRRAYIFYTGTAGLFSIMLFGATRRKLNWSILSMVAAILFFVWMTGCGDSSSHATQRQITTLSVRASAGTGAEATVHSAQVIVMTDSN